MSSKWSETKKKITEKKMKRSEGWRKWEGKECEKKITGDVSEVQREERSQQIDSMETSLKARGKNH